MSKSRSNPTKLGRKLAAAAVATTSTAPTLLLTPTPTPLTKKEPKNITRTTAMSPLAVTGRPAASSSLSSSSSPSPTPTTITNQKIVTKTTATSPLAVTERAAAEKTIALTSASASSSSPTPTPPKITEVYRSIQATKTTTSPLTAEGRAAESLSVKKKTGPRSWSARGNWKKMHLLSGDFNVKDSERSDRPQKCEDEQLQELLDDDPTQTQRQLAEALHVSQETISRRLQAMGKINKLGKWVPHDLNERQMENRKRINNAVREAVGREKLNKQIEKAVTEALTSSSRTAMSLPTIPLPYMFAPSGYISASPAQQSYVVPVPPAQPGYMPIPPAPPGYVPIPSAPPGYVPMPPAPPGYVPAPPASSGYMPSALPGMFHLILEEHI
ncbi:actin cytoskeleton-regulatory complex protein PAN1-like [Pseudomyrmex gracilis]|uniref:actin cytoskeleton-regulatory complex protein PAN1-like n=1 Tax=Pseudomyrmex gracilis TaxID=219809 RepID=UPI0009955315|nr:actin cytoskeleton-regulatory complex protein PAN1-like [Pseudomyrmex gracilis]